MSRTPTCAGPNRTLICAMCGRPPGERCAMVAPEPPPEPKPCPGCDGTGNWPKGTAGNCPHCSGSGEWTP